MGKQMFSCHLELRHSKKEIAKYYPKGIPEDLSTKTQCPVCGDLVLAQRIPKHVRKIHPELANKKTMTSKQRMYAKLYPDERPQSRDILDTNIVFSGGGIGVGKRKKR